MQHGCVYIGMELTQFFALYLDLLSNLHIFSFYPWIFIILTPYRIPYMTPTQFFVLYLNLLSNLIFHDIDFIYFPWESWKIYKISWNFAVKKMYALIPPSGDIYRDEVVERATVYARNRWYFIILLIDPEPLGLVIRSFSKIFKLDFDAKSADIGKTDVNFLKGKPAFNSGPL